MDGETVHWLMWRLSHEGSADPTLTCDVTQEFMFEARCGDVVYRATTPELALRSVLIYVRSVPLMRMSGGPPVASLPCHVCSGDGFVSFEDRNTETRKSACSTCRGLGKVPANTGVTREGSCDPATGRPFGEVAS